MPGLGAFVLVMLLALLAPPLALGTAIAACVPRFSKPALGLLLRSAAAALALALAWFADILFLHWKGPATHPVAVFCFGAIFTSCWLCLAGRQLVRAARRKAKIDALPEHGSDA